MGYLYCQTYPHIDLFIRQGCATAPNQPAAAAVTAAPWRDTTPVPTPVPTQYTITAIVNTLKHTIDHSSRIVRCP